MTEQKRHTKTKILIFAAFLLLSAVLIFDLFRFTDRSLGAIRKDNSRLKCLDTRFMVQQVDYSGNRLIINVFSQSHNNITKVRVLSDSGQELALMVEPPLASGDMFTAVFDNISIEFEYTVAVNDCEGNKNERI